jgi:molybdate transport system substrate-binding protein
MKTVRLQFATALLVLSCATASSGAEIKVLTAGAYKSVVDALVPGFEQRTGHKLIVDNGTAGQIAKRIGDGEAFDVAIITPAAIKDLADAGKVQRESSANVARVGIGVAVKAGVTPPDISTAAAFQKSLLDARAVAYIDPAAGGSSGVYLDKLFEKMGIAAQVRAKAVLVPGGYVAERVVNGQADLGIHQISEILAVPGAMLVGPLPAEVQNYTVYAAALSAKPANAAAAQEFLSLLRSAESAAVLKSKGMEPPDAK